MSVITAADSSQPCPRLEMQFGPSLARAVRVLRCPVQYHQAHRLQLPALRRPAEPRSFVMKESPYTNVCAG
jgi:hypothetical protein